MSSRGQNELAKRALFMVVFTPLLLRLKTPLNLIGLGIVLFIFLFILISGLRK